MNLTLLIIRLVLVLVALKTGVFIVLFYFQNWQIPSFMLLIFTLATLGSVVLALNKFSQRGKQVKS